jgi:predicted small lipoprotein YifL
MSRHQSQRLALLAAFAGALALAGCGKQGVLQQPPPLFGGRAKAAYDAQRAQEEKDDAQRREEESRTSAGDQSAGDNEPKTKQDIRDPAQVLTPASQQPVTGAPDPMGAPLPSSPTY